MQILVLNASALHLGFIGCYGNAWIATPHLDRLAAEGVVFDQHYVEDVAAPFGVESITNCVHVVTEHDCSWLKPCLDGIKRTSGQQSVCWVDLPSLYPPWKVEGEFTEPYLGQQTSADEESGESEPFEPLPDPTIGPLDVNDLVHWERLRGTYAGAVTRLDAELGELFEELETRGLYDNLVIVFTAERGLALGEHGIVGDCRPWLHDEVVHLPLIVRQPGGVEAGRRVFGLTQPSDFFSSLRDGEAKWTCEKERCISRWTLGEAEEWSLRTRDYAMLVPIRQPEDWPARPVQFYRKPEDRWEANNMIQQHLDLAEELEKTLREQREDSESQSNKRKA